MSRTLTNAIRTIALVFATAAAARADVTVTQSGAKLALEGDAQSDIVDIDGAGALGEIEVRVNGAPAGVFVGVRDLEIKTGAGNNVLTVSALQIGGSLAAKLGSGDDRFVLDENAAVAGDTFIGGNLEIRMGGQGGDIVEIQRSPLQTPISKNAVIGGDLSIKGAADVVIDGFGSTSNSEGRDTFVGGNLRVDSDHAADVNGDGSTLRIDDLNVGGTTRLDLDGDANDVDITDSHFVRKFELTLGDGDDSVDFQSDPNEFNAAMVINGEGGIDSIDDLGDNVYAVPPTVKKVEVQN